MSSKITEAIEQLSHDATSLYDAVPSMQEAALEKEKQVETLRGKYLTTHPEILSGKWNLDISLTQQHARLTGWNYDINGTRCEGGDSGNFLISGLAITNDDFATVIKIPYSDEEPITGTTPQIQLSVVLGEIRIDFYNIISEDVFRFIKEHNIVVEIPDMDKQILGFKERIEELNAAKQVVIAAGILKAEPEPTPSREQLFHQPIEENDGVQFNAEAVSALHQHVGITYDYLTNIITQLHDTPEDVKLVEGMTHALFNVQSELDNIAVEVGDLDTKDEPLDLGMAGSAYWNMLCAARADLRGTVEYIGDDVTQPLFVEVRNRLNKLTEVLERCNTEFEATYL